MAALMSEAMVLRSLSATACRFAGSHHDAAVRMRLLAVARECEQRAAELDHEDRRGDPQLH